MLVVLCTTKVLKIFQHSLHLFCADRGIVHHDGDYVAYKLITFLCISFMFIKMKFIRCYFCVIFVMKAMSICND